jgi:hypothetical protein
MRKTFSVITLFCLFVLLSGCNYKEGNVMKKIDDKIVEKISLTKKIIVENSRTNNIKKEITDTKKIEQILDIISKGYEIEATVTTESSNWYLLLYDLDNKLLSKVWVWESGYYGFKNDKEYSLYENTETLKKLINE